jgi:hypothetical protein
MASANTVADTHISDSSWRRNMKNMAEIYIDTKKSRQVKKATPFEKIGHFAGEAEGCRGTGRNLPSNWLLREASAKCSAYRGSCSPILSKPKSRPRKH